MKLAKVCEHRSHWPVRWVPAENLHLTLIFLGNRDKEDIKKIKTSIKKTAQNNFIFRIRLSYYGVFPSRKRPKLIWIRCRNNEDLEKVFDKLYLFLKDKKTDLVSFCHTYLPHVTMGRFRKRPHSSFVFTPSLPHRDLTYSFVADRITLFESILGGEHSIYKPTFSAKLKTSP